MDDLLKLMIEAHGGLEPARDAGPGRPGPNMFWRCK